MWLSALPVAAEIDARLVRHRKGHDPVNLYAVGLALVILAPCRFLSEAEQVGAGDVGVLSDFAPAHPAKEALGVIGVRLRFIQEAVALLVIDPMQSETPG